MPRIIDGQSPTAIANELNRREIPTITGARWSGLNVGKCAGRASNPALREHLGVIYDGNREPIISRKTRESVLLALEACASMKYKRGVGRKYLLTGFPICGACGNRLSGPPGVPFTIRAPVDAADVNDVDGRFELTFYEGHSLKRKNRDIAVTVSGTAPNRFHDHKDLQEGRNYR